jgi:hypothetical protein
MILVRVQYTVLAANIHKWVPIQDGVHDFENCSTLDKDEFCAFISFEQREKLAELTYCSYFATKWTVNILYTRYNTKY